LETMGVQYFKEIFKKLDRENLGKIIKVVSYFPKSVNEEEDNIFYILVTKEELMFILSTFHKDKIPSPNGWSA